MGVENLFKYTYFFKEARLITYLCTLFQNDVFNSETLIVKYRKLLFCTSDFKRLLMEEEGKGHH